MRTIVHLSGGFGNQLFSYAFGYAVAQARGDEFLIDTAIQDEPWFFRNPDILNMNIIYDKRITYHIGRKLWDRAILNKLRFRHSIGLGTQYLTEKMVLDNTSPNSAVDYCVSIPHDIYLKGNWQSEAWFESVAEDMRSFFTFKEKLTYEARRIYDEIYGCPEAVTVHIRRGDYVGIGVAILPDYYMKAMQYMAERLEHPVFYCFSEDLGWARQAFRELPYEIRYPEYQSENKGMEDFRLLGAGKHCIISNSTYSWWAAWLNRHDEKIVIVPCREDNGLWNAQFVAKGWIPLDFEMSGK